MQKYITNGQRHATQGLSVKANVWWFWLQNHIWNMKTQQTQGLSVTVSSKFAICPAMRHKRTQLCPHMGAYGFHRAWKSCAAIPLLLCAHTHNDAERATVYACMKIAHTHIMMPKELRFMLHENHVPQYLLLHAHTHIMMPKELRLFLHEHT